MKFVCLSLLFCLIFTSCKKEKQSLSNTSYIPQYRNYDSFTYEKPDWYKVKGHIYNNYQLSQSSVENLKVKAPKTYLFYLENQSINAYSMEKALAFAAELEFERDKLQKEVDWWMKWEQSERERKAKDTVIVK